MIKPGVYQHYKGPLYRVLFLAEWMGDGVPKADATMLVEIMDGSWVGICSTRRTYTSGSRFSILTAKWSGNTNDVADGDPIVIYVSLSESGRVSARTVKEFEQRTGGDLDVARFVWVSE